jgi:hypothetical protein
MSEEEEKKKSKFVTADIAESLTAQRRVSGAMSNLLLLSAC